MTLQLSVRHHTQIQLFFIESIAVDMKICEVRRSTTMIWALGLRAPCAPASYTGEYRGHYSTCPCRRTLSQINASADQAAMSAALADVAAMVPRLLIRGTV
jgi:hypothetical protein